MAVSQFGGKHLTVEEKRQRAGMLMAGVILGGLFSMIAGIWSGFFIEWYKSSCPVGSNPDWVPVLLPLTVILIIFVAVLVIWTKRLLR